MLFVRSSLLIRSQGANFGSGNVMNHMKTAQQNSPSPALPIERIFPLGLVEEVNVLEKLHNESTPERERCTKVKGNICLNLSKWMTIMGHVKDGVLSTFRSLIFNISYFRNFPIT